MGTKIHYPQPKVLSCWDKSIWWGVLIFNYYIPPLTFITLYIFSQKITYNAPKKQK